jgi:hypothetical protein
MAPIFTGGKFGFGRSAAPTGAIRFTVTGGTITTSGDFTIHTFTSPGSFEVTGVESRDCHYMIIGGGGSGSFAGGGAGGALIGKGFTISPGSYTVDVGDGGTGTSSGAGNPGQNSNFYLNGSSFPSPTYLRGVGGGGGAADGANGANGGSGGGAFSTSGTPRSGGTGTPGQGTDGGPATSGPGSPYNNAASGGGGSRSAGGMSYTSHVQYGTMAGHGGQGFKYAITGSVQGYASGGGGSSANNDSGVSQLGYAPGYGGGTPGQLPPASSSTNATANTGGGGGGRGGSGNSASGGSGVVVIKYLTNQVSPSVGSWDATGGTITTPGNGYKYHAFTNTGISTFTVTSCPSDATIELLIVAAGGGAGGYRCSGGGGGGIVYYGPQPTTSTAGASYPITSGSYDVVVGSGNVAAPGDSSSFDTVIAIGGGAGVQNIKGFSGGSGSGAGVNWTPQFYTGVENPPLGALGVPGQGNRGGGISPISGGGGATGGGGGAGAVGGNASGSTGGNGGSGLQFPAFTGPLIGVPALNPLSGYYAGGGAGAAGPSNFGWVGGTGGAGGGGTGNQAGVTNSGGGAASGYPQTATTPVAGGPGIVVLRYAI